MARPEKWRDDYVRIAENAAKLGATDREVGEMLDVSERTIQYWKHSHPKFAEALKVGKDVADERVVQSLYRKAVGYTFDSVKYHAYEGVVTETPCVEHVPPSDTAAIFWLKNRQPERWRDVKAQEISGPNGAPVAHSLDVSKLSEATLRELAAAS